MFPVSIADSSSGLAVLGPAGTRLVAQLDACFESWAQELGGLAVNLPPLVPVKSLQQIDYFDNFPHLGLLVSPLRPEAAKAPDILGGSCVAGHSLADSAYVLPSAACYNLYFSLAGTTLGTSAVFTTKAQCFRQEREYQGLQRLMSFQMREIVALGDADHVAAVLDDLRRRLITLSELLGLPVDVVQATDPFFDAAGPRALMQRLSPLKQELRWGGELALASLNAHRNFFGERCDIALEGGQAAFSGCVGMGLERWLGALLSQAGGDPDEASAILSSATEALSGQADSHSPASVARSEA